MWRFQLVGLRVQGLGLEYIGFRAYRACHSWNPACVHLKGVRVFSWI